MTDTEKAKLKGFFDRLIEHGELKTDGSQFYIKKVFGDRYDLGLSRSDPYMGKLGHVLEIASNDIETAKLVVKRYRIINSVEDIVVRLIQLGYKLNTHSARFYKAGGVGFSLLDIKRFAGEFVEKDQCGNFYIDGDFPDINCSRFYFDPSIVEEYEE